MSSVKEVVALIAEALDGNAEINAWCQDNFGKIPSIFVGIDAEDPPQLENNAPLIRISPGLRYREARQAYRAHSIDIGCLIMTKIKSSEGQIIKFGGMDLIDEFASMVEEKVTKALNVAGYASTQEPSLSDRCGYPFFEATWTYMIRCPSILPK